jgi:hypothetical protein
MVYRVVTVDGKICKFISDNLEFIESFFSVKGKYQSISELREATDEDFDNLRTLG